MQCAVGFYTGNGVDHRAITGLGWRPALVIIKAEATVAFAVFRTADMAGDATGYFAAAGGLQANFIESLDADGFTLGDSATVNQNTFVFHWQAFRDVGGADFAHGSYVGNGGDDRDVVAGLPFSPAIVVIKRDGPSMGVWKPSSLAGDSALYFTAAAAGADRIQALNVDGFQVGANDEVNAAANDYYWFAFAEVSGWVDVGSYVGNGLDDQNKTGVGFPPSLLWVKSETVADGARHRPSSLAGDLALEFANVIASADAIQALAADGFQVGTDASVNQDTKTFHYAAWRAGTSCPRAVYDPLLGRWVMHDHRGLAVPTHDVLLGKTVMHAATLTGPTYDPLLGKMVRHTHV